MAHPFLRSQLQSELQKEKNQISGYSGPQGPYYCGVGAGKIFGRDLAEKALDNMLYCKLNITGLNFEVAPGQCEFQICDFNPNEL